MKEFTITGIPDGFEPIDKDLNKSIRDVQYLEYYLLSGIVARWNSKYASNNQYLILKKTQKPKQYRPFTLEEAKYRRDRWIRFKNDKDTCFKITGYDENYIYTDQGMFIYKEALEVFVFDDTELPYGMEVIQ